MKKKMALHHRKPEKNPLRYKRNSRTKLPTQTKPSNKKKGKKAQYWENKNTRRMHLGPRQEYSSTIEKSTEILAAPPPDRFYLYRGFSHPLSTLATPILYRKVRGFQILWRGVEGEKSEFKFLEFGKNEVKGLEKGSKTGDVEDFNI